MNAHKAEERSLSDQIYHHLQMLMVIYPSSPNFQHLLALDMFIKPNTKAFPFVMHYLFNIHDSAEFKKRFYWPLLDRNSENKFRSTTVQYLNYLNEKHSLGWGEVKSFLVVMPGGMKFMRILMDLINLVIDEEIKKVEKSLPDSVDKCKSLCTEKDLKRVVEQHQIFISKAIQFKEEIHSKTELLKENTATLKETLEDICKAIDIGPNEIDEQFAESFAESNQKLFEKSIVKEVDDIEESEALIDKLSNGIDKFYSGNHQIPYDKEALMASYETIREDFPQHCPNSILSGGNKINLKSLFDAFNCIVPSIDTAMAQFELKDKDCYEFEENTIKKIIDETNQLEYDISEFENTIDKIEIDINNVNLVSTPYRHRPSAESNLKLKYVQTPAIYVDPEAHGSTALSLLDDNSDPLYDFANQSTVIAPRSARSKNMSFAVPGYNKSKFMDPLTLMRTIPKPKTRKLFRNRNDSLIFNNTEELLSQTIIETPANTRSSAMAKRNSSFKTTELETSLQKYSINKQTFMTPDRSIYDQTNRTKSVHDVIQSLDLSTMSKSPSGRLDSLVAFDKQELPEIYVNDTPMTSVHYNREELQQTLLNDNMMDLEIAMSSLALTKKKSPENKSDEENLRSGTEVDIELQQNRNFVYETEESIFNISDGILNDILM